MKLEVGMYAYSKHSRDYGIGKIVNIHTNGFANQEVEIQYKDVKLSTSYDDVIASHSLIDLIEVEDYVNGELVVQVSDDKDWVFTEPVYFDEYRGEERHYCYNNSEIKSIITKEQFESVKYEVNR